MAQYGYAAGGYGYGIGPRKSAALFPPSGFIFLVDSDGAYLVDSDGAYLVEAI